MPRRKNQKFDIEGQKEKKEKIKEMCGAMLKDLEIQLSENFPDKKNAVENILESFAPIINSEVEATALEYNSQSNPRVKERELVKAIFDIEEGTHAYENLETYERQYRRIKELLKHDKLVGIIIERGIREKDKENYIRFIKKIINNPDYKKALSKANKAKEGENIKIHGEMLDELLNLLDSMAETPEEKRLVKLRQEYFGELKVLAQSYQEVMERLLSFTFFDIQNKLDALKLYLLDFEEVNKKLYDNLDKIDAYASKKEEVSLELVDYLYSE